MNSYPKDIVIVAYGRSPLCRARKGSFATVHPVEYAAQTLNGVVAQIPEINFSEYDDVIVGNARSHLQADKNIARLIVLRSNLPYDVPAQTVNRFCSAGLQTITTAANAIAAGQEAIMIAGGVESMSMCFTSYADELCNEWLLENEPGAYMAMGETAERVADKYDISRKAMEKMAVVSHAKAAKAQAEGKLAKSIIPVEVIDKDGNKKTITEDEGIRPGTTIEKLAELEPCFRENGRITAATSSQMTDGAAFVVLMERAEAEKRNIKPFARILGSSVAGLDPTVMGLGPIYAVPKVMKKTGLTVDDMDIIEINEAFAAQALACIQELNIPMEKVNPYGGAMALGHPLGATGAVLMCKAIDYLKDNNLRYGLITMCIGGGQGAAGIIEAL
ncbi:MAG: thiolase family protein [Lachnospiraceae bacterium]|jgi:acetyl-CoA acyltransferase